MSFDTLMQNEFFDLYVLPWTIRIITAVAIFVIGRWVAKLVLRTVRHIMEKAKLDPLLVSFLNHILYGLLISVVVLAALEQLGVKTTSALAILGAAGLAIGLALRDSLANFAAGVMLIMFRPFKVGDYIEAASSSGIVEAIHIFSTILRTGDNRVVTIPNGQIYGGTIINYSARETRRIDMVFGIGYDDDLKKAKSLLEDAMQTDARILSDPAPVIMVMELADSSVNIAARPWVKSSDYWAVRSDLLEAVKAAFDANGISIPFPQRDVHLYPSEEAKRVA